MSPASHCRRAEGFRWLAFAGCLLGAVLGGSFLVSCASFERTVLAPPEVPGASFVGNQACADCHQEYTRLFAGSPHARVHLEVAALKGQTGCESCHGPGSLHVQQPAVRGYIVNPRKDAGACFQCHVQTHAEFNLPQHHPLLEGKMNCVQCHDPHGFDIRKPARGVTLGMARLNESCAECHREQARPFVYEHEVMREGCTACHQPHGSVNRAMLLQADNNLCLKCHAQTPGPFVGSGEIYIGKEDHTTHLQQGGCWTSGCHTAVHGSNISPRLRY
jgi:predicted CXXCH cytochrome family protein